MNSFRFSNIPGKSAFFFAKLARKFALKGVFQNPKKTALMGFTVWSLEISGDTLNFRSFRSKFQEEKTWDELSRIFVYGTKRVSRYRRTLLNELNGVFLAHPLKDLN